MFQSLLSWGRGVVTVGMVVVSDTRAPRFESCHRNIILHFLFTVNFKEKKIKRVQELPWLINKNILCTFHFNLLVIIFRSCKAFLQSGEVVHR